MVVKEILDVLLDELAFAKRKLQNTCDAEAKEYLEKYIAELERDIRSNSKKMEDEIKNSNYNSRFKKVI